MKVKLLLGSIALAVVLLLTFAFDEGDWYENAKPPDNLLEYISEESFATSLQERKKIEEILSQPFHYLDEGGQSYVFVSEDGRYILKFFKYHRFRKQWFAPYIPDFRFLARFKDHHTRRREKRLHTALMGHQLAFSLHREESGLYFVQIIPSPSQFLVVIKDKNGKKRTVDLGRVSFVIQEKGEILGDLFSRLLKEGQIETVKQKSIEILNLYQSEYEKGIYDTDHGVMHNVGFLQDKPLHLDVGNFVQDEAFKDYRFSLKDLRKVAGKIKVWVEKNFPEHYQEISRAIDGEIQRYQERQDRETTQRQAKQML